MNILESPNSYNSVVKKLSEYLNAIQPETFEGSALLDRTISELESTDTPLFAIREFLRSANEEVVNDAAISKAVKYIKSVLKYNSNMNFQLGICKEEHLTYLKQMMVMNPSAALEAQIPADEFNRTEIELRQMVRDGVFDSLQSETLQSIKNDLGIQPLEVVMTENGYNTIITKLSEIFANATADTAQGQELIDYTQRALFESKTPMFELREFLSGAQKIAKQDTKLLDVIKFCKKTTDTDSLNFLINLCKEEHFAAMTKAGHPNPEETIEKIKDQFNLPDNEIKKQIEAGVFDGLQSKLLGDIKNSLSIEVREAPKPADVLKIGGRLNESIECIKPVGFAFPTKEGKTKFLLESKIYDYDTETQQLIPDDGYVPSEKIQTLQEALEHLTFDSEQNAYVLNLGLLNNYIYFLDGEKLQQFIEEDGKFETIEPQELEENIKLLAQTNPHLIEQYKNEINAFRRMVANRSRLIQYDNITMIKNLHNGNTVLVEVGEVPRIIGSEISVYDNFKKLVTDLNSKLNPDNHFSVTQSIQQLYDLELIEEGIESENIRSLREELETSLKSVSSELTKIKTILDIVDKDSPVYDDLTRQYNELESKSNDIIAELKGLV